MDKLDSRRRNLLVCLLLVLITTIAYLPTLRNGFTSFDDPLHVTKNLYVQRGLSLESIAWSFSAVASHTTSNWHPLTWLSLMLDFQIYHLNPLGYHLTSLLFHLASTCLLFLVLMLMTGSRWRSALVAALFAVHPLHVESVAWVSERKDVLSGFFWMLAMLAYLHYSRKPSAKGYLLVCAAFVLGMMSKPMLVTLPLALLMLDYWPLDRFRSVGLKKLVVEKVPLLVISGAISVVAMATQSDSTTTFSALPITARLSNAAVSYVAYLIKTVWPRGLAAFYPHPLLSLPEWQVAAAAALLVGVCVIAFRLRKTMPHLWVGWLWYLVSLVPVIGIVQIGHQALADRYTYLPLTGIFIMIAWSIPRVADRRLLAAAGTAIVGVLMWCTWVQIGYWHDSKTLFRHALRCTANNYVAYDGVGAALAEEHKYAEAVSYFKKAIAIKPTHPTARTHLGFVYMKRNRPAEAEAQFRIALEHSPWYPQALSWLAESLGKQGKYDEAVAYYERFLGRSPEDPQGNYHLGWILIRQRKMEEAIPYLETAVKFDPRLADAHAQLAKAFAAVGRTAEAADHRAKAIELWMKAANRRPKDYKVRVLLGNALMTQGRSAEAAVVLEQALKLNPRHWQSANNLAFIYASERDPECDKPERALELARTADQLTGGKRAEVIDTLAAALAANGRFVDAVTAQRKAISLMPAGQASAIAQMQQRLQLYQSHRPFTARSAH